MRFFRITFLLLFFAVACLAQPLLNKNITIGDVRVPVILVQFDDVKFTHEDPKAFYTDFLNKEGFNEYGNVGSVRDYFVYNSMGKYRPSFDVYGPVTLPNTKGFYEDPLSIVGDEAELAFVQAVESLLSQGVDFSAYDNDGDSVIEFFAMINAGERISVNESLWPAMHKVSLKIKDDLMVLRFVGVDEGERVSTFVHEYGHMLGLPDLSVGGRITLVDTWSVMDNPNQMPPLFLSFDRMLMGWLTPSELGNEEFIRLDKLDDNVAISITNPENENEMYLLEYRTQKLWDVEQVNSGMLIWYVDYNDSAWGMLVNSYKCHAREYVVRARSGFKVQLSSGESCSYDAGEALPSDVFPGTGNVTSFDGFVFRNGLNMNITLSEITESEDKNYVTFKVSRSTPYMEEIKISSSSSSAVFVPHLSSSSRSVPYSFSYAEINDSLKPFGTGKPSITQMFRTRAMLQNGSLHIRSSVPGEKNVRLFSLNGQVLYEMKMNGFDIIVQVPSHVCNQKFILIIEQDGINLTRAVL
ncbi:M6 family metalloprotease domain-containing protein [Fibrobacter sp. UWH5]|uniref:M6 family metalloprotease domain-containing protein n=1 Tax=Fibrobacter sp. UWH5 TaxID=1896211 RepID=UPI0009120152|nr:M6 family metalloprotease domain-containing protein [Fibrobacter sp. UWH5]SHL85046.1 M6 family metalloprotease domain-containing protein [Fibrobacter sp. UWH5]